MSNGIKIRGSHNDDWISHRATEKIKKLNSLIEKLSQKLFSIYETLDDKEEPFKIYLKDRHCDSIDDTFREKMNRFEQEQMSRYLQSNNQRAAIIELGISAILCILRKVNQFELEILDQDYLTISDHDLTAALYLADNFFDHATRLFQILPNSDQKHSEGTKFKSFYRRLPDEFETKQAESASMPFEDLCRQMAIAKGPDEALKPINAGLMFFCKEPQRFFKRAWIEVVFRTDEAGTEFTEKCFKGPLHKQL